MTKSLLWVIFSISLYTQKSYILININMVSNLEISPIYCPKLGVIYDQKNNTNFVKKMCIFSRKNKIITTSKAGLIGGRVCIVWNRVENEIILFRNSCSFWSCEQGNSAEKVKLNFIFWILIPLWISSYGKYQKEQQFQKNPSFPPLIYARIP